MRILGVAITLIAFTGLLNSCQQSSSEINSEATNNSAVLELKSDGNWGRHIKAISLLPLLDGRFLVTAGDTMVMLRIN